MTVPLESERKHIFFIIALNAQRRVLYKRYLNNVIRNPLFHLRTVHIKLKVCLFAQLCPSAPVVVVLYLQFLHVQLVGGGGGGVGSGSGILDGSVVI